MGAEDLLDAAFPGDDKPADVTMRMTDQHAEYFPEPRTAVLCEQRLDGKLIAAWTDMPSRIAEDADRLRRAVAGAFDRVLRPWRFPDANPMPTFRPFRTVALIGDALGWVQRRLAR